MKKFNIDELIWFIILVLLTISIIFLIKSGNLTNFVSSEMVIYFYLSIFILAVFSVFQVSRIFTISRRNEITNKFIPITFTLCIGVILLYVFPLIKGANSQGEDLIFYNKKDAIEITSENYEILNKINEEQERYEGKKITFLGYVDGKDSNSDFIILSREAVSCCQADKEKLQVRVKGISSDIKLGQWVNILGEINFDDSYYIFIEEYKLQSEPQDIYFHEKL